MTHPTRSLLAAALVTGTLAIGLAAFAQDVPAERQLVLRAAEALGGVERIQSLQTMTLRGYGHEGYQDGGSEITTEPTAPGVWLLYGTGGANSILREFENHLTLFEVPTSRAWTEALSRNPQPPRLRTVDDHLQLSDAALTVDLYRMIANGHMAHGLMAYVPEHRLLIQGDLFDMNWEVYFWGRTYEDNVDYRNLVVERDVPVHGRVLPLSEVCAHILEQTRNAAELCANVDAAGLTMPGCPLAWSLDEVAAR
jgi:hypothetical protein